MKIHSVCIFAFKIDWYDVSKINGNGDNLMKIIYVIQIKNSSFTHCCTWIYLQLKFNKIWYNYLNYHPVQISITSTVKHNTISGLISVAPKIKIYLLI